MARKITPKSGLLGKAAKGLSSRKSKIDAAIGSRGFHKNASTKATPKKRRMSLDEILGTKK